MKVVEDQEGRKRDTFFSTRKLMPRSCDYAESTGVGWGRGGGGGARAQPACQQGIKKSTPKEQPNLI